MTDSSPSFRGTERAHSFDGTRGTVLLTGATGFLGSHVAEALLADGWSVRCTVRPTSNLRWIESLRVERVTVDLREESGLLDALAGVDTVVHSAGLTRARSASEYSRVNAEGTQSLAEAAIGAGVGRFVLVSSLAARGPDPGHGVVADRPTSPYGESKLAGERRLFQAVARTEGVLRPVILRPGGIFGPRDEDSLTLFRAARAGLLPTSTSRGRLQPVYVKDVAEAIVRAVARPETEMGPFHIAGAEIVTWEQLGEALSAAVGRRVRLLRIPSPLWQITGTITEGASRLLGVTPHFDRRTAADLSLLDWTASLDEVERGLGWRPTTGIGEALSLTADWYREQGWLAK